MIRETATLIDLLPGGIEASEARGQQALVHSDLLPVPSPRDRAMFEAIGIRFGNVVDDDPLFVEATLPLGWKKVGTSHAMHSKVVDDKGRERISIFYKAAFYDRRADMGASRRFSVSTYDEKRKRGAPVVGKVQDADGSARFTSAPFPESEKDPWEANDAARAACLAWLGANYPDYENPLAYWDVP